MDDSALETIEQELAILVRRLTSMTRIGSLDRSA